MLFSKRVFKNHNIDVVVITLEELQKLSQDRLKDVKVLYETGHFDWAVYTCGYAVELALKKKICETLRWKGYPSSSKEFEQLKCFKTHDLGALLHLSGVEDKVKEGIEGFQDWSIIASWNPDMRYSCQETHKETAKSLIEAVKRLLEKL